MRRRGEVDGEDMLAKKYTLAMGVEHHSGKTEKKEINIRILLASWPRRWLVMSLRESDRIDLSPK